MTNDRYVPINKGNYLMDTERARHSSRQTKGAGRGQKHAEYRKNWSEFARRQHVSDCPLLVDIELSSIWNLTCPMCYTLTEEFKEQVLANSIQRYRDQHGLSQQPFAHAV